jgi:hypothetical protein
VSLVPTHDEQLPFRLLQVLYFGVAHAALLLAFAAVAVDPRGVSGFFYHSRVLGIVHLVTGVSGLFVGLLFRSPVAWMFALMVIAGFAAFLSTVVWMLRHPRTRPSAVRVPDPAVWHAASALACR